MNARVIGYVWRLRRATPTPFTNRVTSHAWGVTIDGGWTERTACGMHARTGSFRSPSPEVHRCLRCTKKTQAFEQDLHSGGEGRGQHEEVGDL